ncbi:hypothetical protein GCM10008927_04600 [Amylibacter ulvae]|uniref:DUF1858 domain-containing protein n=1 Tax=Paramylibacter ulvae TaxID=1651968 RepID=A0ABQ3CVC7_9RHOB|nr:hypothetical protein GCM10008927_04600 [Amylibacter ulvae]
MEPRSAFDADTSVLEIMDKWPETIGVFIKYKMFCVGCTIAPFHSLRDACNEHQLDEETILVELLRMVHPSTPLNRTN